eukprot:gnl/TRDRNA2_/TRDRNA2_139039_c2_seq1.p1 gnl/TRDRNA2_/TRDRNA2_139039_c2~~gnl/TRDRNA2_/TRDRNA2_139039_c2_seq1.p1  ORF type:complete len:168 (+),score=24.06 gnl/TRDRNA2_/TRDRNA2_139039_c2_seq1:23-505(+)
MRAVREQGLALRYVAKELRGDKEVVLAAVGRNIFALAHAAEELRCDRDFLVAAVRLHGFAMEYATKELVGDSELLSLVASKLTKDRARGRPRDIPGTGWLSVAGGPHWLGERTAGSLGHPDDWGVLSDALPATRPGSRRCTHVCKEPAVPRETGRRRTVI